MDFTQYRKQELYEKLCQSGLTPLDLLIVGQTGGGKTSTINTLFNRNVGKVGYGVDPETMEITPYRLNDYIRIWDSPGFGDGADNDKSYKKAIKKLLKKEVTVKGNTYGLIDLVLVVLDSSSRDLNTAFYVIRKILKHIEPERVLVVVNQADFSMKGRNWDETNNKPNSVLLNHLKEQAEAFKRRIYESTGLEILLPVFYSAKLNYNIEKVFDLIIDNIPKCHREKSRNSNFSLAFNFFN